MDLRDFAFSKHEVRMIFSLQYLGLVAEASGEQRVSWASRLSNWVGFTEDDNVAEKCELMRRKKLAWIREWGDTTKTLLEVSVLAPDALKEGLTSFLQSSSHKKLDLFALEVISIAPYYKYPNKKLQPDVSGIFFDEDRYLEEIARFVPHRGFSRESLAFIRSAYLKALSLLSKGAGLGVVQYASLIAVGALIALILAPYLAAAIGSAMGLSGAAATSAGLAFLGGGSLAAGGLGMAGGSFALMAGGCVLGYLGANAQDQATIRAIKSESLLVSSAKLLAAIQYWGQYNCANSADFSSEKRAALESALQMEFDIEKAIDAASLGQAGQGFGEKDEKKKSKILRKFRELVRKTKAARR